jgi:hypothetical protein
LKKSIYQLERKVDELYSSIKSHEEKALIHKNRGETKLALVQLQAKKSKVAAKDKYSISLVQLEEAFMQIEDVGFNIIITNAYQTATNGMKSIRETGNLTVETIDDALDAFNDEVSLFYLLLLFIIIIVININFSYYSIVIINNNNRWMF